MSIIYERLSVKELREKAKERGYTGYSNKNKKDIIALLRSKRPRRSKSLSSSSPSRSSSPSLSWNPRVPKPAKGLKLTEMTVEQLRQKAKMKRCHRYREMNKVQLINEIRKGCKRVTKSPEELYKVKSEKTRVDEVLRMIKKMKTSKNDYAGLSVSELRSKLTGCPGYSKMNRANLIERLNKGCN